MLGTVILQRVLSLAVNDDLLDEVIIHAVDLLRFSEGVREQVIVMLEDLQDDLATMMRDADLAGIPLLGYKARRSEALIRQARETIETAYRDIDTLVRDQMINLAPVEAAFAATMINTAIHTAIAGIALTPKELTILASDVLIQGSPAKDWWDNQSRTLYNKFAQEVRLGLLAGESNDDIVRRIIGRATGNRRVITVGGRRRVVVQRAGGIMDLTKRQATALVRTATQTVGNEVLWRTYEDNQDILRGVQLIVTLDLRTSAVCRGRAGAAWDFNGDPLPNSPVKIKFPGRPPYHINCRSVLVPIVKTWSELTGIKGLPEFSEAMKASMNGQIPAGDLTYDQWLKTQPEAIQRRVLGEGRFELWSKKGLHLSQMIDPSGRSLTLDELRRLSSRN